MSEPTTREADADLRAAAEVDSETIAIRPASSVIRDAAGTGRGRIGIALLGFVVAVAAVGPFVAPDDPNAFVTAPFASPSAGHLLGGDALGRDVLSRMLAGGWELLLVAAIATFLGVATGALIGILAAVESRSVDSVLMRSMDVLLAFPQLVFALLLVSVVGPKVWLLALAVALTHMPAVARVIRAAALDLTERDFIRYGELIGLPRRKTVGSEIVPNLASPLMVETGLRLTYSIIVIAGLSFLGFGLQPPDANWGTMINENRPGLVANPWGVLAPVLMLVVLTVGTNLFTDAIAGVSLRAGTLAKRRRTRKPSGSVPDSEAVTV